MVTFKERSFVIEVQTSTNPIEDWLSTHDELCSVLQGLDDYAANINTYYSVVELLRQMMPDLDTAKKMTKE